MKVVILCGGSGTRMEDYSLPKPLNMIYGTPAIKYCLEHIPESVTDLYFVVAQHLLEYNFEEIVKKEFKTKRCHFSVLPYFTRGPIESAFIGIKDLQEDSESIVFLDNDNLYVFPEHLFIDKPEAFLGYAKDITGSESYSFLRLDEHTNVLEYKEKKRISDNFVCGIYGFATISQFRRVAKILLDQLVNTELYMSLCYQQLLQENKTIKAIYCPGCVYHIGSLKELQRAYSHIPVKKMRVCFDLDNTLVTYPTIPGDYTTVKPIPKMIDLLNKLYSEGHTIIIYTARRMETHKHNVGSVIRDIAKTTLDTLEKFNIQYNELLFGKPIADIYIDDRAINPYFQKIESMGYLLPLQVKKPINFLCNNRYNSIEVMNDTVIKKGPYSILKGEIYYYENLPYDTLIIHYFPKVFSIKKSELSEIAIEYIKGIPLYTLFKSDLFTEKHMDMLFEFLDCIHNYIPKTDSILPTKQDIYENYIVKLEERFKKEEDYPFNNSKIVQEKCLFHINDYLQNQDIRIVPYIHGDFWLSNIMIDYKQQLKVIDMKGYVGKTLTTGGDYLYDYAKLYQSILGFDSILYNSPIKKEQLSKYTQMFKINIDKRFLHMDIIRKITFSLVIGTLHAIDGIDTKMRIWDWICTEFIDLI